MLVRCHENLFFASYQQWITSKLTEKLMCRVSGLQSPTFGVFKVIHQAVLFPAMHQLHSK
jgi:hypothetical protein